MHALSGSDGYCWHSSNWHWERSCLTWGELALRVGSHTARPTQVSMHEVYEPGAAQGWHVPSRPLCARCEYNTRTTRTPLKCYRGRRVPGRTAGACVGCRSSVLRWKYGETGRTCNDANGPAVSCVCDTPHGDDVALLWAASVCIIVGSVLKRSGDVKARSPGEYFLDLYLGPRSTSRS